MSQRRTRRERRDAQKPAILAGLVPWQERREERIKAKADADKAKSDTLGRERFRDYWRTRAEMLLVTSRKKGESRPAQNLQHIRVDRQRGFFRALIAMAAAKLAVQKKEP